jgi:tryptophan-rich sensory protein
MKSPVFIYAAFIILCLAGGGLGGAATAGSVRDWYPDLAKPGWTPPSFLFGPVWSMLYIAMGVVAARLHLRRADPVAATTLKLWWLQFAANVLWSPLFFGLRRPDLALVDIALLLALLLVIAVRLRRGDLLNFLLWLPYLAWVTFAAALNLALWRLN